MATDQQSAPFADDSAATVQRLMDQYTEIARLAGGLAHEIKNPLSTIRLNMELLAEDLGEAESPVVRRSLKRVDVVRRECQRLQSLLDDFLNFAKVRRLHLEPTDLNHQIDDVLEFFAPEAKEAGIEIVRYLDPELPHVMLDRAAFRQALLNLIINAKQAMPDGGQLVVRTAAERDMVVVYLDRYRLWDGRADGLADVRGVLFHEAGRLGVGPADDAKDRRCPRRADRRAKRSRSRHADYDRAAGAGADFGAGE